MNQAVVFSSIVTLPGGEVIRLRPARQEDEQAIEAMHERLSPDSLYYRYLNPAKPSRKALRWLAVLESYRGAVVVAEPIDKPGEVIGIGCYVVDPNQDGVAEPALLVEDRYQGQGIGRAMINWLRNHAEENGVKTFRAQIHPLNRRMLSIVHNAGLPVHWNPLQGTREVVVNLASLV